MKIQVRDERVVISNFDEHTRDELVSSLDLALTTLSSKGIDMSTAKFMLTYDYDHVTQLSMSYMRPETDYEESRREKQCALQLEAERATYEKLKAKFEPKE